MTDLEKVVSLLDYLGIGNELDDLGMSKEWRKANPRACQRVTCREGMSKVDGYCGFEASFYFDSDGTFTTMGIWE